MKPLHTSYHHIHLALGGEMSKLEGHALSIDPSDQAAVGALNEHLGFIHSVLDAHATEEERVLWPVIEARLPGIMDSYEIDHREERAMFTRIHADIDALANPSLSDREATHRRLTRSLAVATEELKLHMAKEEEHVYGPFSETQSDEEWKTLLGSILGGLPPEMLPMAMPWLASFLTAEEIAESFTLYEQALGPDRFRPFVAPLPGGMPAEKWQDVLKYAPQLGSYVA